MSRTGRMIMSFFFIGEPWLLDAYEPRRGSTISTLRLCARPSGVELEAVGCRYARPEASIRPGGSRMVMSARTTAEARAVDSSQLEGYVDPRIGTLSV